MGAKKRFSCPLCDGKGGFWDTPDGKAPLLYTWVEPPDFWWGECPECGGSGEVEVEVEEYDPYEDLLHRPEEKTRELRDWVDAYREARKVLPPEEARAVADLAVYGPLEPLPF